MNPNRKRGALLLLAFAALLALGTLWLVGARRRGDADPPVPHGLAAPQVEARGIPREPSSLEETGPADARAVGGEVEATRAEARATKPAGLEVRVVDVGGVPIAGAWVRIGVSGGAEPEDESDGVDERTNEAGIARFTSLPDIGAVEVRAWHDVFLERTLPWDGGSRLEVVLRRAPWLEGWVLDATGVPVVGLAEGRGRITAYCEPAAGGDDSWRHGDLRADGSYVIEGLDVGRLVRVEGDVEGFPEVELSMDVALVAEHGERLDLALDRGAVVTGRTVRASDGEPVPGARVWSDAWSFDAEGRRPHAFADERGRFLLEGVAVDRHVSDEGFVFAVLRLNAETDAYSTPRTRVVAAAWQDEARYDVELALEPRDATLHGRVLLEGSKEPVARAIVHAIDAGSGLSSTLADEDGAFAFEGLPAGPLHLLARSWDAESIERLGLLSGTADVTLDGGANEIDVELRAGRGRIGGRVADPDGVPLETIVALELRMVHGGLAVSIDGFEVETDEAGRFEVAHLAAGHYAVTATREGAAALPRELAFELPDGASRTDLAFTLGEPITFAGSVDAPPERLRSLDVALRSASDALEVERVAPDASGVFVFLPVPRGRYLVVLLHDDEELASAPAGPADALDVLLRLER